MGVQLELPVKSTTIREAAQKAYEKMPKRFASLTLCLTVRSIQNKMTMDGTILRRLRELRDDNLCPYKVVDTTNGIYEKIDLKNA